jgi:hypothetical protein
MKRQRQGDLEDLWEAVYANNAAGLKKLKLRGTYDINGLNAEGFAPLHYASEHRMLKVAKVLVGTFDADVNVKVIPLDFFFFFRYFVP